MIVSLEKTKKLSNEQMINISGLTQNIAIQTDYNELNSQNIDEQFISDLGMEKFA